MDHKTKILIDMDIGDDIDDAFALFLAMKMNYDIVGITTVFKNTDQRARITKKLLSDFGNGYEKVPVYAGYGNVYGCKCEEYPNLCQYTKELDDDVYAPDCSDPEKAVDFIIDCCEKYGKELTVIAIGPFTNIAKAIEKSPSAFYKISKLAIMGGAFFRQYADWNVMCDPIAAKIMFDSLDNLECMGADVTHRLDIGKENSDFLISYSNDNKAAKYVCELYSYWCKTNPGGRAMLHDPLVVYYVSHPEICKMENAHIIVFTEGFAKGLTFNLNAYRKMHMNEAFDGYNSSRKAKVASDVDKDAFVDLFMSMFY